MLRFALVVFPFAVSQLPGLDAVDVVALEIPADWNAKSEAELRFVDSLRVFGRDWRGRASRFDRALVGGQLRAAGGEKVG